MASESGAPGTAKRGRALAAAACIGVLWGCNVFAPLASDKRGDLSYRGLILKGNQAINDGDYAEAEDLFRRAMEKNPAGSEAYLYHSKAIIALYGIDYSMLNAEFECRRPGRDAALCRARGIDTAGIPFLDSSSTASAVDSVYYPVATAVDNLEHILRKSRDTIFLAGDWKIYPDGDTAGDGKVSDGVARLDLGLLQAVKALLAPIDLDGNGRVDDACGRALCDADDDACMSGPGYREKCREGPPSEVNRLESFKRLTRRVSLDNLDSKDVDARDVSTNPNDINAFLDAMQGPVAGSNYNLDSVTRSMASHGEGEMSGKLSGIMGNINDLNNFLSYMRYDDGLDNDGDAAATAQGGGGIMVWHDFDRDGGIRYDYDEAGICGDLPPGSCDIGHPMHRRLHPDLYREFGEWARFQPDLSRDTSKNSRKALMIKHCRSIAEGWAAGGALTEAIKDEVIASTCTTYTPMLKPGVRPPRRSDWQGGTPGIDEEMVDERDNDYDGLKDEDGRNAPGMDDDDDAAFTLYMIDDPAQVLPMAWADDPASANQCPDIVKGEMPEAPFQRRDCIGSLEHRIHLALTHGADSAHTRRAAIDTLATYYTRFTGNENGPEPDCLEDFAKLPEAYRTAAGLEVTDDAVRVACMFKHVWIRPMPPGSEWTSGVFGIDEEVRDGVDNDGDGWIDEDLK